MLVKQEYKRSEKDHSTLTLRQYGYHIYDPKVHATEPDITIKKELEKWFVSSKQIPSAHFNSLEQCLSYLCLRYAHFN
jgi:hypothetical protein